MTVRTLSVTLAVLALTVAVFAQGPRRDGRWEVTMQMEMAGMPAGMPPFTTTQCITPDEAKDPDKSVPQMGRGRGRANQNCKTTDQKIDGNKVTSTIKCDEPAMTGKAEFVYTADSYTGTVTMDTGRGTMTQKISAKRLGDCVK